MKIKNKIYISIALLLPMTIVYYLTYVSVHKLFSKWCKTNYCFEFPPYADTLAIYVALVGLYFVVNSLNEWKDQEKYFKSRTNLTLLSEICAVLKSIDEDLLDLKMTDLSKYGSNDLLTMVPSSKGGLNKYLNDQLEFTHGKVERKIRTLKQEKEIIVNKSNGLFQEDINCIFNKYSDIISNASSELNKKIEKKGSDSMKDYQQELNSLYNKYHSQIENVLTQFETLELKLDDFLDR